MVVTAVLPAIWHREADVPVPRCRGGGTAVPPHPCPAGPGQLHAVANAPLLPAQQPWHPVQVCHGSSLPALGAGALTEGLWLGVERLVWNETFATSCCAASASRTSVSQTRYLNTSWQVDLVAMIWDHLRGAEIDTERRNRKMQTMNKMLFDFNLCCDEFWISQFWETQRLVTLACQAKGCCYTAIQTNRKNGNLLVRIKFNALTLNVFYGLVGFRLQLSVSNSALCCTCLNMPGNKLLKKEQAAQRPPGWTASLILNCCQAGLGSASKQTSMAWILDWQDYNLQIRRNLNINLYIIVFYWNEINIPL